jgi:hypothetical protein
MTIDTIDLLLPVPRPKRPKYKIGPIRHREQRQAVDAAVFPYPVPGLHVVGMRIFFGAFQNRPMPAKQNQSTPLGIKIDT